MALFVFGFVFCFCFVGFKRLRASFQGHSFDDGNEVCAVQSRNRVYRILQAPPPCVGFDQLFEQDTIAARRCEVHARMEASTAERALESAESVRPRVCRLSGDTQNQITATKFFPAFQFVLKELVENSVDAGATFITSTVDLQKLSVIVSDDGHGITKDGLKLVASVRASSRVTGAQPLSEDTTSESASTTAEACSSCHDNAKPKVTTLATTAASFRQAKGHCKPRRGVASPTLVNATTQKVFCGQLGQAMHSLAAVSTVSITTRSAGRSHVWQKVIDRGKITSLGVAPGLNHGIGTTVCVTKLFSHQVVRRKILVRSCFSLWPSRTTTHRCPRRANFLCSIRLSQGESARA